MAAEMMGLGDLRQNFEKLAADMTKKTALKMVVAGGKVLLTEAKALAQGRGLRKSGALIRNIAIKRESAVPFGIAQVNLGVRHGKDLGGKYKQLVVGKRGRIVTAYKDNPYYWSFLEFGTRRSRALPFIAPALANKRAEAITAMSTMLTDELGKYDHKI